MNSPALIAVCLFAAASSVLAATDLQPLLDNSPFGKAPVVEEPVVAAGEAPLEFRSLVVEDDRRYFSVFDPASQRGHWIAEGEEGGDIVFVGYDAEAQQLVVRQGGRSLELALKRADIVAGVMPTVAVPNNAPAQRRVRPAGQADARRLEAVAAEVRRRRALRQSAAGATR